MVKISKLYYSPDGLSAVALICSVFLSIGLFVGGEIIGGVGWVTVGIMFVGNIIGLLRDGG